MYLFFFFSMAYYYNELTDSELETIDDYENEFEVDFDTLSDFTIFSEGLCNE